MADCACCKEPVTAEHKLTFEMPDGKAKTVVFCSKCSKRIGDYIRLLRRLFETGEVIQG